MLGEIAIQEIEPEKAYEYFNRAENVAGCAYSKFLQGELEEARILSVIVKDSSPIAHWIFSIICTLTDNFIITPTYFQIRNFYEQDLEMLFKYKQFRIIEELIKRNPFLENHNKEIYKYSARVLFNNGYYEQAKSLLLKSLDICYKDPETHFILGEIYEKENNIESAKSSFQKAIESNGEYSPATRKLNLLSN